jgi:hypothetical protein
MSRPKKSNKNPWLERCTEVVLILVIASLGWMVLAEESWLRLPTLEAEVLAIVACCSWPWRW